MTARTRIAEIIKGVTGATSATRGVVGATTSLAPTTGTFQVGDVVVARDGAAFICTAAGTPGTWATVGKTLIATYATTPAAGPPGQLLFLTDVAGGTLYRSDGATWAQQLTQIVSTKGDLATYSVGAAALGVGTAGQQLLPDSSAATGLKWITPGYSSITSAIAETLPARAGGSATVAAGASGQLRMQTIWLPARVVIASITFVSGSTALTSGTHGWAALYDSSLALLRQSTDDTSIAWTNAATHTFTLSSTYTITTAGWYYLGLMVASTGNMPTLTGSAGSGTLNGLALISSGTSTGSLTGTAPNPAAALAAVGGIPYAYVS